jgi:ribonuclease HI
MSSLAPAAERDQLRVAVYSDGGCSPTNPGPAAAAAVVFDEQGAPIAHLGVSIGEATNNVAEWTGVIRGMELALQLGATHVEAFTDSRLVEGHFCRGTYIGPTFRGFAARAAQLRKSFASYTLTWVPREHTSAPDRICRAVLKGQYDRDTWVVKAESDEDAPPAAPASTQDVTVSFVVNVEMDRRTVRERIAAGATLDGLVAELAQRIESRLFLSAQVPDVIRVARVGG